MQFVVSVDQIKANVADRISTKVLGDITRTQLLPNGAEVELVLFPGI